MANLLKEMELGAKASQLLDNETYKDAVRKVREGLHHRWATSPIVDREGQHELRLMLKLLDDLEGNIREVAMTGKMAEKQLIMEKEQEKQSLLDRTLQRMGVRN